MDMCRDRFGYFNSSAFQVWSCAMCFTYLFPEQVPDGAALSTLAAIGQATQACRELEPEKCGKLRDCCRAALDCCSRQLQVPPLAPGAPYCPRTWDGFRCWEDTAAGSQATQPCPTYLEFSNPSASVHKLCLSNGSWLTREDNEWTDYTGCVHMEGYRLLFYVGVGCNGLSLLLLLPACLIFLGFRSLREQHRIRLHLNLFLAFLLRSIICITWNTTVFGDRLDRPDETATMYSNAVACKMLNALVRYVGCSTYTWMFLEGFHLRRLLSQAFRVPRSIRRYYLIGWGMPLIFVTVYISIRVSLSDERCWVDHAGAFEWLIYGPNLLCILANVYFLGCILRTLISQLQTHPNEPSSYRRALRAMCVLVPLFGLQMFLVIYRPSGQFPGIFVYEIIAEVIANSQGMLVALLFCFFNGEVHAHLHMLRRKLPHQELEKEYAQVQLSSEMLRTLHTPVPPARFSPHLEGEHVPLQLLAVCRNGKVHSSADT